MRTSLILSAFTALVMTAFRPADTECFRKQGIKGHVYLVKGNQMPSPDVPPSPGRGFATTLYIYELTHNSQTTIQNGAFYTSVATKLVKEIQTAEDGSFKVKLKPGKYSLFVKKGDLFYSNVFDGNNNIHPVEVKKGEWAEEDFKADYDAVY
ncbi:MAG: hypothetical protein JNK14_08075 [Chitinophagaceae bacterium]|nr:hypothetical protein [Chitinophagaceae bacterium]